MLQVWRVADRAGHPRPSAAVQPGALHLRPDRRAARDRPGAEAAVEAEVARRRTRRTHRSIAKPIVKYLCELEAEDKYHQLVVLIPEVQPRNFWYYLFFNQRGLILDRAIKRGTVNVVLCRLRYRLEQIAPSAAPSAAASATAAHASTEAPPPPG